MELIIQLTDLQIKIIKRILIKQKLIITKENGTKWIQQLINKELQNFVNKYAKNKLTTKTVEEKIDIFQIEPTTQEINDILTEEPEPPAIL